MNDIVPLEMGTFTFPDDEPWSGEEGVVIAYAVRHPDGIVLFDTGFGFGDADLDARYHPVARPLADVLAEAGIGLADITTVANCHLHVDHAGQNARITGIPILVQPAEWEVAHTTDHTILDWIDGPGVRYEPIAGDHDIVPGIRIISTPGHTPGHQSLLIETAGGSHDPRRPGGLLGRRVDGGPEGTRGPVERLGPGCIRPLRDEAPRPRARAGPLRP